MMEPTFTSVIHLIAHPELYDGQRVRVIGFCVLGFEGTALYVTEADYRAAVTKNAVWLDVELGAQNRALDGTMALVEGTFDGGHHGHLGMYAGCIKDVVRLEPWRA